MRVALLALFIVIGAGYGTGAFYFWTHERRAQSPVEAGATPVSELEHPEATLAVIRQSLESNDFSPRVRTLLDRAVQQTPAFYQPPLYLAVYHANRLEQPVSTYQAFEAAIRRYPANGRLRLDYARWLLMAPSLLSTAPTRDLAAPTRDLAAPTRDLATAPARDLAAPQHDFRREGEAQLRMALTLEPDLTRAAIETLEVRSVPAHRWPEIVPDDLEARHQLVLALARGGHRDDALALVRTLLPRYATARRCRQVASWALSWGDPELALRAVARWRELDARERSTGIEPHEAGLFMARAHLALGNTDSAYDVFRSTLQTVQPSSSSGLKLLCAMGNEFLRRRRVVLAESIFTEATSYSPTYVAALLGLARTYSYSGQDDKAMEHYDKLLGVDPDNAAAKRELMPLLTRRSARSRH